MKNTIKALTLALVLSFSTTIAMADGIIIGDRADKSCDAKETYGIIIGDRSLVGDVFEAITGIIIGDSKEEAPCVDKEGIIIGDR